MHVIGVLAGLAAVLSLSVPGAAQETDLLPFEGRWAPRVAEQGFLGPVPTIDLARCQAGNVIHLCGRAVSSEGACGPPLLRLLRSGGEVRGVYLVELRFEVVELEMTRHGDRRGRQLEAEDRALGIYDALTRSRLDDRIVEFDRVGPPACAKVS